jgi:NAD(P)-dependent dehydrogenase (short-subunit alcohol dehydrogenase family)
MELSGSNDLAVHVLTEENPGRRSACFRVELWSTGYVRTERLWSDGSHVSKLLASLRRRRPAPLLEVFRVNPVGPTLVTQALFLTARQGWESRIVSITSDLGSLTMDLRPGSYAYAMSKRR